MRFPYVLAPVFFLAALAHAAPSSAEPAAPAPAAPGPAAPATVHVAFRAGTSPPARIYARGPSGFTLLCTAPCEADLAVGTELRIAYAQHEDEPIDAVVADEDGNRVRMDIRRGGRGAFAGGIVMLGLGGASALTGLVLALVGQGLESDRLTTAGAIAGAAGVATFVGGMFLVTDRTWEPVVKQRADTGRRASSKHELVTSDVAVSARDTTGLAALPAPATPFGLRVSF